MGRHFRVWSFRLAGCTLAFIVVVLATQFGFWLAEGEPRPVSEFPVEPGVSSPTLSGSQLLPPGAENVKPLNEYWYEFTLDGRRYRMLAADHASLAVSVVPAGEAGWRLPEPYHSRVEKHIADGGRIEVQSQRWGYMLVFKHGPGAIGEAPPEEATTK